MGAEVSRLTAELEAASASQANLQKLLRTEKLENRLRTKEASELAAKLALREAEAKAAQEALAVEEGRRPERDREAIERYKRSEGFLLGLDRTGRVSYEYGYKVALARFRACPPGSMVEEDPFTSRPEDQGASMPDEVPFDDSLPGADS
ncbi:unnamed protein product [Musa textilis]